MSYRIYVAVVLVAMAINEPASADTLIYSNGFDGLVGSEWSHTATDTTPIGGRSFLGQFFNDEVTLELGSISAPHDALRIEFDLFIIRSWDGNNAANIPGEVVDLFRFGIAGDSPLLITTFDANPFDPLYDRRQAYPDAYPGGDYHAGSGAVELDTLGYFHPVALDYPQSAVYRLSFELPGNFSQATFAFAAEQLEPNIEDESWGLDNVQVFAVPEPATATLAIFAKVAVVGIAASRAFRRKRSLSQ